MFKELVINDIDKIEKAYNLYKISFDKINSLENIQDFDLEIIDAFFIRFERVIELILSKISKSIDIYENGNNEGTLRDRLHFLTKINIIKDVDIWIEMRNLRNKIVHDYIENLASDMIYIIKKDYNYHIEHSLNMLIIYKNKL